MAGAFDRFPEAVEGAVGLELGVEVEGERLGGGLVGELGCADPLAGAAEGVRELVLREARVVAVGADLQAEMTVK